MQDNESMTRPDVRRDAQITIRIPKALRKALEREAGRQRRTVSDLATLILSDAMAKRSRKERS